SSEPCSASPGGRPPGTPRSASPGGRDGPVMRSSVNHQSNTSSIAPVPDPAWLPIELGATASAAGPSGCYLDVRLLQQVLGRVHRASRLAVPAAERTRLAPAGPGSSDPELARQETGIH